MYNGDRARKEVLVDYGFRLPSALDNRPLKFDEFEKKVHQVIYVSATPGEYELSLTDKVVEQTIIARQKSLWDQYFLYMDVESLIQRNPSLKKKYISVSAEELPSSMVSSPGF